VEVPALAVFAYSETTAADAVNEYDLLLALPRVTILWRLGWRKQGQARQEKVCH
jgi:hypothetical protein